jgi:hypothetical protein
MALIVNGGREVTLVLFTGCCSFGFEPTLGRLSINACLRKALIQIGRLGTT